MSRRFNFSAGPATLPLEVLEQVREDLPDYRGLGASVMEISHRSPPFDTIAERSEARLRALFDLPADYAVLFLAGGARMQFAQLPINLAAPGVPGAYVVNGYWGRQALAEAARQHLGVPAAELREGEYGIPEPATWKVPDPCAYLHITSNETIEGVQFPDWPRGPSPLVADMSSDILSRPLDVTAFGAIYASAQKNIGPAGLTLVIVHRDLLERSPESLPGMLSWACQAESGSRYNTPPTFAWYMADLVFGWLQEQGGLQAIEERNERKAGKLYACIDGSAFYHNPVPAPVRSRMNVPFTLADSSLDARFLSGAEEAGLIGLKGHRAVGGMRASLYNAMPEAGVDALVDYMHEFERSHS